MPATVHLGSGIISLATAYYTLLQSPSTKIHIIDPSPTPYPGASRKAAGFLAKDWFSPAVAPLGALSFELHRELAELHGGAARWGYSASIGVSLAGSEEGGGRGEDWLLEGTSRATTAGSEARARSAVPAWVVGGGEAEVISGAGTTAQVDPERLCTFLHETLLAKGVEFHLGARAERVAAERGAVVGVDFVGVDGGSERYVACDQLLIACGAWSRGVFEHLFPAADVALGISALAGYSLAVHSPRWRPQETPADRNCSAVFTVASAAEGGWAPEIFGRRDGDIYIGGLNTRSLRIPASAADAGVVGSEELESMLRVSKRLLGEDVEVVRTGLCFRPVTGEGRPVVAGVEAGVAGVWVAAGHGPWGISLSLGTGKVMAEMMAGAEAGVDVSGLGIC